MKELIRNYVSLGLLLCLALEIAGMSSSSYFYKSKLGKPGRKPSTHTERFTVSGHVRVPNNLVVERITEILEDPFVDYGYRKTCFGLQNEGYHINKKKVYRLMKENGLLHSFRSKNFKRIYVKYKVPRPTRPFEVLEMDIKYVYVHGKGLNAYILTIIDTFTRVVLGWKVGFSMKQWEVMKLWKEVIVTHLQPADLLAQNLSITVRSDNGSQFLADKVRAFMAENHMVQEFTHPYTPQENGHVESFHAILGKALAGHIFENLEKVQLLLEQFYYFYNYKRIHSSICNVAPMTFLWALEQDLIEVDDSRWKIRFKLKISRQELYRELAIGQWSQEGGYVSTF